MTREKEFGERGGVGNKEEDDDRNHKGRQWRKWRKEGETGRGGEEERGGREGVKGRGVGGRDWGGWGRGVLTHEGTQKGVAVKKGEFLLPDGGDLAQKLLLPPMHLHQPRRSQHLASSPQPLVAYRLMRRKRERIRWRMRRDGTQTERAGRRRKWITR